MQVNKIKSDGPMRWDSGQGTVNLSSRIWNPWMNSRARLILFIYSMCPPFTSVLIHPQSTNRRSRAMCAQGLICKWGKARFATTRRAIHGELKWTEISLRQLRRVVGDWTYKSGPLLNARSINCTWKHSHSCKQS